MVNKYFAILNYIIKNNNFKDIPRYFFKGLLCGILKSFYKSPIILKTFNKKKIYLFKDSSVSSLFTYCLIPDKEEILILRRRLRENNDLYFVDVGANIGSYSILLADLTKNIIAIEPHPKTNLQLKMNFKLNEIDENQIYQLAIGASNKEVFFTSFNQESSINKVSNSKSDLKVTQKSLDTILDLSKEYIFKIDVEGYELEVLKGMKELFLKNCVTGIIIESFDGLALEMLSKIGFQISKTSQNNYFVYKKRLG
jgi:FkbM family methyltransferase